jgi:hypothetical protein
MPKHVHLSARVDPTTKALLDRYVRSTGVKKGHVLEEALRHHLQALQALASEVIVHPVLVLTGESGERVRREIRRGRPTRALRALMRRRS